MERLGNIRSLLKQGLHNRNRFTGRSGTKIKISPSFYFRWKDLPFQSNAFRPELCTKNIY